MTIFAQAYLDEDVDILVATLLLARGLNITTAREQQMLGQPDSGIIIVKRRNPYEIAERIAILFDTFTADEIANQLLYL